MSNAMRDLIGQEQEPDRKPVRKPRGEVEMSEYPQQSGSGFYMTPEDLQKILSSAMASAVAEARKMTPMEQRKYNEEIDKERRRDRMAAELAKAEMQAQINRQRGCSHKIDSKGQAIGRDRQDGFWITGGQLHSNDLATLACLRCGWCWRWKTTPAERDYINTAGMLHMAPPAQERVDELLQQEEVRDRATMMKDELPAHSVAV